MSTVVILPSTVRVDGEDALAFSPDKARNSCFFVRPDEQVYMLGQGRGSAWAESLFRDEQPVTALHLGLGKLEHVLHLLVEGGAVIDQRHLTYEEQVVAGSVRRVDPYLTDALATPDGWAVSIDAHVRLQAGAGARVGYRQGDTLEWADGTSTRIESCTCWKRSCLGCRRSRYYVDRVPPFEPTPDSSWWRAVRQTRARIPDHPFDHCPNCRASPEQT
jgi:hypothetical protein